MLPLLLISWTLQCHLASAGLPQPKIYTTSSGTPFGLIVSDKQVSKKRSLLVSLTGAMSDTLGCNATGSADPCYYANACEFLVPMGWACASLDLPSHGAWLKPGEPEGIAGWRWRFDRKEDFRAEVIERIRDIIDFSIAELAVDSEKIAVSGISRGGFIAAHYAVTDPRIKAVGLLSPVTNISLLTEFDGAPSLHPWLQPANSTEMAQRNIWAIIGDQDTRVYTDALISFMRHVQCSGCHAGPHPEWGCTGCPARSVDISFRILEEPLGHTVPPSSPTPAVTYKLLAAWMEEVTSPKTNYNIAV